MYKQTVIIFVLALLCLNCLVSAGKTAAERRAARRALRQANRNKVVPVAAAVVPANVVGEAAAVEKGVQAQQQSALNVGEANAGLSQAQLEKLARKQDRLDAKRAQQARKNQGHRLAHGEKLQAQEALDFANYENAAVFEDTDAAASKNTANRFGLALTSEDYHKEDAALSSNHGKKAESGVKLSAADSIAAADYHDEEGLDQLDASDLDALSAAKADEGKLNAAQGLKAQEQFQLQAQDFSNIAAGFANGFDGFGGNGVLGGFGGGLGGGLFGNSGGIFGGR